ncbi:MAG: hypothetical protein ACLPSH_21270 [Vulcanimicrobiaceae bacterium]
MMLGSLTFFLVLRIGPHDKGFYLVEEMDFRAYYCSGAASLAHADPFHVEPIRSCEHREQPNRAFNSVFPSWAGMPAPYPGYVVALFSLFALLPFAVAKALWAAFLVAALALSAFLLAELSGLPLLVISLALIPTALLHNLKLGSAPPIALAGLTVAAVAMARGKPALAAPALAAAMIDPHLALPSAVALASHHRTARSPRDVVDLSGTDAPITSCHWPRGQRRVLRKGVADACAG